VVHGPRNRIDEFAELRSCELAGIFWHEDLRAEYNTTFDAFRLDWIAVAKSLIGSMEITAAQIQLLNENQIAAANYRFCAKQV